ncbi:hypothetical protein JXM67_15425 [candidate division WOR-3 bacterium]|nr:hypothetical protein [candidate division WOR-3 bacterium]
MSERRFTININTSTPLDELGFATQDYPWDLGQAMERLKQALGLQALAAYCLWVDPLADPGSAEFNPDDAYRFLVVDLVEGEPKVVPLALKAAADVLKEIDERVREKVGDTLAFLQERLRRESQAGKESLNQDTGQHVQEQAEDGKEDTSQTHPVDDGNGEENEAKLEEARLLVDRLVREGRLLRAWDPDALTQFIAELPTEPRITGQGVASISSKAFFLRLVESLPCLVPLSEFATPSVREDTSFETLGRRIAQSIGNST